MSSGSDDRVYWDTVGVLDDTLPAAWRRHARDAHLDLFRRWVGRPEGYWLKTDLYEERSPDRALLPLIDGPRWVGMDLSPIVVASASVRAVASDVRRLPFATGAFDGILSTSTLDHFDDVRDLHRSLVELRRVLRPGGRMVLTLDNPRNPLVGLRNALPDRLASRTGMVPFSVGATLDARAGRQAVEAAGFRVDAVEHLLHVPHIVGTRLARWPIYARRVMPRFAGLGNTSLAPRTGHFAAFLATGH